MLLAMAMAMAMTCSSVHTALVDWIIQQNGGTVHPNLTLHTPSSLVSRSCQRRGIFARRGPIAKGETLIRLPPALVLDGSRLPPRYYGAHVVNEIGSELETPGSDAAGGTSSAAQHRNASPWLRCLASYIQARGQYEHKKCQDQEEAGFYDPYIASLPEEYDSLLNWSEAEIQSFLAGTALGVVALQDTCYDGGGSPINDDAIADDRQGRALRFRYTKTVRPYLEFVKSHKSAESKRDAQQVAKRQKVETTKPDNNNEDDDSYSLFREGCMCISTRAFHMQSSASVGADNNAESDNNAKKDDCYDGPYLLPYIDLLNHSPRGSTKHVTTLRRDADGSFVMVAERDIAKDEEICHSYTDSSPTACDISGEGQEKSTALNSAQLLQTFGFVDVKSAGKQLLQYYQENKSDIANITPAVLTKSELSNACKQLANSSYPSTICKFMDESGMSDAGWEHWEVSPFEESSPAAKQLTMSPEELIISFGDSISDELITLCCLHFLP